MIARHAVLLARSKSSGPPQRPSYKRPASVTHLGSTLPQHRGRESHLLSTGNPPLCFLTLTKCKFSNSFVLTFIQNAPGCGGRAPFSLIELSTFNFQPPLLSIPFFFKLLRTLLHTGATQLSWNQFVAHSFRRHGGVHPSGSLPVRSFLILASLHLYFVTSIFPLPSFSVWMESAERFSNRSTRPLGQRTCTQSIFVAPPRPKWTRTSLLEI